MEEPTDFASVLITHAKGRAHDEASLKLREAVEAVQRTGKAASVTVKVSVKPIAKIPNAFELEDKVTAIIPDDPRVSIWYSDHEGGLHRNNPDQPELPYTPDPVGKDAAAGHDN